MSENEEIKNEMEVLENEMNLIKAYNKLFIITFDNKDDYKKAYDKYPHLLPKELLEPSLISIDNKYIYI